MKKIKIVFLLVAVILALTLSLSACDNDPITMSDPEDISDIEQAARDVAANLDMDELSADTDSTDAELVANGDVTLSESGKYLFRGDYGKIVIAESGLKLHFFLDNAHIGCDDGIAIDGSDVKKTELTVTLAEGTDNSVSSGAPETNVTGDNAVQIKGSLDINGQGALAVSSNGKNGVKVSKGLRITDADVTIEADNHAVAAMYICARDCNIEVKSAGKDGLNAECDDETDAFTLEEGFVALRDVTYSCVSRGDGIQADTVVYIDGGSYDIVTQGEFVENTAANREEYDLTADDFRYIRNGDSYEKVASDFFGGGTKYALKQGCKGVKVGEIEYPDPADDSKEITVTDGKYFIVIEGGDITVDSTDDAVHANSGNLLVKGGSLTLSTFDDGLTADKLTRIAGGTVDVLQSYEGIEGGNVEIAGGNISVVASDDGINAASDDLSVREHIIISGGDIVVNAGGDGIDSNGSVEITGGTVTVYGPTSDGDGGLDSETGIYVNGGTLIVLASRGMTELPVDDSAQYVVAFG